MRIPGFFCSPSTIAIVAALAEHIVAFASADPIDRSAQVTPIVDSETQSARTWQKRADDEAFVPRDSVKSPSRPDSEYVKLLNYSLLFYEAQRSGKLPPNKRVAWRNDSALQDGSDRGLDLTGGYYDAGDYLKFSYPLTFTMTEICWGGYRFFEGYQLANQTTYLDDMVRWGMNWLIKAHPNDNTFFVQVGVGEIDNNYWGPDTNIPNPRTSYMITNTKPGTDAAADAAAAFSACSVLYSEKLNDRTYAGVLAAHADSLFRMAETATPQQVYQNAVPAVVCCYASSGYVDELAWAAAWMYRRTKDAAYKAKAAKYLSTPGISVTDVVTWDSKAGFVPLVMAEATVGEADNDQWIQKAIQYAEVTVNPSDPCKFTRGGMYWCKGSSDTSSMVVPANAALGMRMLTTLLSPPPNATSPAAGAAAVDGPYADNIRRYNEFAQRQTDYILGDNPMKTPYIVGVHPNSPANPHSAMASGGTNAAKIDTEPVKEAYVLYGALVGGPDVRDRFEDKRSDWAHNEVALDYNAPFTALVAHQVMTSDVSPPYVAIPEGRPDLPTLINGMEIWQVILIAVAVVFVLIGVCAAICYRKRVEIRNWLSDRKERKRQQQVRLEDVEKRTVAIQETKTTEQRTTGSDSEDDVQILK
ncbi:hypothetical protein BGZ73_006451 [Actinomortierella ambigua]|nr:hypothetical protein BGZ73_006451 [Actinomortierella ambigua]